MFIVPVFIPVNEVAEGETRVAIKTGTLCGGRRYFIDESARSAVPEGQGRHFILHFGDEHRDTIPVEDRYQLLGKSYHIARKLCAELYPDNPERFRIEVNGLEMSTQSHFHIHIICVAPGIKVRRSVDKITLD